MLYSKYLNGFVLLLPKRSALILDLRFEVYVFVGLRLGRCSW